MNIETQQYFVYENWQAAGHKAKIHNAECSFCNFGKGIHGTNNSDHGQWLGPYTSFSEANKVAIQTRGTVSVCKFCEPKAE